MTFDSYIHKYSYFILIHFSLVLEDVLCQNSRCVKQTGDLFVYICVSEGTEWLKDILTRCLSATI